MVRELSPDAIEAFLHEEVIARVAYVDMRGRPGLVTIAYAYDGRSLFGYSMLGAKLDAMSQNPYVCIGVDRVDDAANWRTVLVRGVFEPLAGDAARSAVEMIAERLRTVAHAETASTGAGRTYVEREGGIGIAYRVRITERHGRWSVSA